MDVDVEILSTTIQQQMEADSYPRLNYLTDLSSEERAQITEVALVQVTFLRDGREASSRVVCIKMDGVWYAIDG